VAIKNPFSPVCVVQQNSPDAFEGQGTQHCLFHLLRIIMTTHITTIYAYYHYDYIKQQKELLFHPSSSYECAHKSALFSFFTWLVEHTDG